MIYTLCEDSLSDNRRQCGGSHGGARRIIESLSHYNSLYLVTCEAPQCN